MSDIVNSGNVLSGYIPEKFGDRLVHIDAAHPLAARLVTALLPERSAPVLRIVGGEHDGGIVDLNDCTLDYALTQLGSDYRCATIDGEAVIGYVAPAPETPATDAPVFCGCATPKLTAIDTPAPMCAQCGLPMNADALSRVVVDTSSSSTKRRGAR